MNSWVGGRAAGCARALLVTAFLVFSAGSAAAQASSGGDWGNAAGDAVVIKAGSFDVAITDIETQASIFSSGKVADRKALPDGGTEFMLKPASGKVEMFVVDVSADGTKAEVFVVQGGSRHKAASLTK